MHLFPFTVAVCLMAAATSAASYTHTGTNSDNNDAIEMLAADLIHYPDEIIEMIFRASVQPEQVALAARYLSDPNSITGKPAFDDPVLALMSYPTLLLQISGDLIWLQHLAKAVAQAEETLWLELANQRQHMANSEKNRGVIHTRDQVVYHAGPRITTQPATRHYQRSYQRFYLHSRQRPQLGQTPVFANPTVAVDRDYPSYSHYGWGGYGPSRLWRDRAERDRTLHRKTWRRSFNPYAMDLHRRDHHRHRNRLSRHRHAPNGWWHLNDNSLYWHQKRVERRIHFDGTGHGNGNRNQHPGQRLQGRNGAGGQRQSAAPQPTQTTAAAATSDRPRPYMSKGMQRP